MAYDENLAEHIRELVRVHIDVTEKKMFGGVAFLIGGNMSVAASGQGGLLVRIDPAERESFLQQPHAAPCVMRGRPMNGWIRVEEDGLRTKAELERWVARGVACARSLPSKR